MRIDRYQKAGRDASSCGALLAAVDDEVSSASDTLSLALAHSLALTYKHSCMADKSSWYTTVQRV